MSHGLQALDLELERTTFLRIRVAPDRAYHATHEASLWVIRELSLDGSKSALLGKEHIIGSLDACLLSSDV